MFVYTVIALSNFFISNFPDISWYPYWYLGNPFHYLIGPVVPFSLLILNKAFFLPVSFAYLFLIFLSFLVGALGLYALLRSFKGEKKSCLISAILFLILPFSYYILFYQNGLHHIAFGFLPWILILYRSFLEKHSVKKALLLSIAISIVILVDISILLQILIGFIVLVIVCRVEKKEVQSLGLLSAFILSFAVSLATVWYTPGYFLTLLKNPSFGGLPLLKLVQFLFQLLLQIVPIIAAVSLVKWRHLKLSKTMMFGLLFFSSFFFLTIIRFISDPDFIMDWIGFLLELQFGAAIILGSLVQSSKFKVQNYNSKFKTLKFKLQLFTFHFSLFTFLLIVSLVFDFWILGSVMGQSNNGYQSRVVSMLKKVPEGKRVFLSGSPVFFLNSKLDLAQVRGGMDQASTHPFWADAAYQIREGKSYDLTRDWLTALGVSYILVHESTSQEPFKDFKIPSKFKSLDYWKDGGEQVNKGDKLYKADKGWIARVAGDDILSVLHPKNGADFKALRTYLDFIKRKADFTYKKPNSIEISANIGKDEVLSLAVSYSSRWKMNVAGIITKDSLGNMIIIPQKSGEQKILLIFSNGVGDYVIALFFSVLFLGGIVKFEKFHPYLLKSIKHLSLGVNEDEEEY